MPKGALAVVRQRERQTERERERGEAKVLIFRDHLTCTCSQRLFGLERR